MRWLAVLALVGLVACGQSQSQSQTVTLHDTKRSYSGADLERARATLAELRPRARAGWRVGVVLAVFTGYTDDGGDWHALVVDLRGAVVVVNDGPYVETSLMRALVSPGDTIRWDDRDGDSTVTPPDELEIVEKA